jgi:hypothetical protein
VDPWVGADGRYLNHGGSLRSFAVMGLGEM